MTATLSWLRGVPERTSLPPPRGVPSLPPPDDDRPTVPVPSFTAPLWEALAATLPRVPPWSDAEEHVVASAIAAIRRSPRIRRLDPKPIASALDPGDEDRGPLTLDDLRRLDRALRPTFADLGLAQEGPVGVRAASVYRHGLVTALTALGLRRHVAGRSPTQVFLAGLYHDVGMLFALATWRELESLGSVPALPDAIMDEVLYRLHDDPEPFENGRWSVPRGLLDACIGHHRRGPDLLPRARHLDAVSLASGLDAFRHGPVRRRAGALADARAAASRLGLGAHELRSTFATVERHDRALAVLPATGAPTP